MKDCDSQTRSDSSGWHARLALDFARLGLRTALVGNRHTGPLRVQKPLHPEGEAVCHAIVLHPPAGIVGGDCLEIAVNLAAGAHALLTTPGAGKWYRSGGPGASLTQTITVADGAICEWLPQETLVFDGARGGQTTEIELAGDARFIGIELICFGRTASGERFAHGDFSMRTRIHRDGQTLWLERGRVAGNSPLLASPVGLVGQPVVGTMWVVGAQMDEGLRNACRAVMPEVGTGGVTLLPGGVLLARWLGPACEPGREWFARLWAVLRPALTGRAAVTPRIWNT